MSPFSISNNWCLIHFYLNGFYRPRTAADPNCDGTVIILCVPRKQRGRNGKDWLTTVYFRWHCSLVVDSAICDGVYTVAILCKTKVEQPLRPALNVILAVIAACSQLNSRAEPRETVERHTYNAFCWFSNLLIMLNKN